MHDFVFNQLLPATVQPLTVLLLALASYVANVIATHVKNKTLADALTTLDGYVARAVGAQYQRTVKDAKASAGWTVEVQQRARDQVLAQVRAAAPQVVATVRSHGADVAATLDTMLEHAVADLGTRVAK